ncbi:TetR/AcrR family transcriptional regulator [Pontibacter sp. JH31]|uniref:TetR/AcrR family transcriptional regulator n=1 Tax=Pontibacter aquaedesilientis TaxID=2766980 RepID=A0ABR7XGF7_9BACT|nr:TetR/AcrR family transcriptional regulator [Pontibacter aquaedesilientis]
MIFIDTILSELLQFFKREGIESHTDEELIRKLDIRQSTFNELFRNRADMVRQVTLFDIEEQKREQVKLLANANSPVEEIMMLLQDGIRKMREINPVYISDMQNNYPEAWGLTMDFVNSNNQHVNADILNRGILQGYFRKDINLQLVTKILLEQFFMMINPMVFPPDRYDLAEVFRSIYLYYVRGICTEVGGKQAEQFFSRHNI